MGIISACVVSLSFGVICYTAFDTWCCPSPNTPEESEKLTLEARGRGGGEAHRGRQKGRGTSPFPRKQGRSQDSVSLGRLNTALSSAGLIQEGFVKFSTMRGGLEFLSGDIIRKNM